MTTNEFVRSLMEVPEYSITGFTIGDTLIELFVSEITLEQMMIPKSVDGRQVKIFRSV